MNFEKLVAAFRRHQDGWLCRARVHITGPNGPLTFTPGVTYRRGESVNGYDVAAWLDDWRDWGVEPVHIQVL